MFFRKSKPSGFTLIELLVVLLIIGLSFTFALLAFGDFGRSRNVRYIAEEMKNIVELYRDQAILESTHYTLITNPHGFKVFQDDSHNSAQTPNKLPVKKVIFPNGIVSSPSLKIEILASRYITPFTLSFGTSSHKQIIKLIGKASGELHIEE